jgi:hypothetical protein
MNRRLIVEDGRSVRELLLVGTVTVGRDPKCEISHADPRLSRRHAEFTLGPAGVAVRDLGSRNGIRVNGSAVTEATLSPGDVVQIAQLTVRFVDGSGATTAPPARRPSASVDTAATISGALEDDRTRVAPGAAPSGISVRAASAMTAAVGAAPAVAAAPAVSVTPAAELDPGDDRTRVVSGVMPVPRAAPKARDLGEVVFREPSGRPSAAPKAAASPAVGALLTTPWGRRALVQGLLLAGVVFAVSTFPLIVWQMQTFGASVAQSFIVLVPGALASAAAGLLIAGRIARTVARGVRSDEA